MQYKDKILIVEKKTNCAYKENSFVVSIVINFLRTRYIFSLVQSNIFMLNVNDTTELPAYENFTSIILPFNLHLNDKKTASISSTR